MRIRHLAFYLGLALALAACGKPAAVEHAPAAASTPAGAPSPAVVGQKTAEPPSDLPTKITRMNEDGSETVEDVPGDSGAHNPLLAAVASTVAASTSAASAATISGPTLWQEGVNYTRLVPAQPTAVPAGQVEVLEFFWYACPHCNALDPMIESWRKTKPAYISFSRVHVLWNEGHRSLARLYYTLDSLGKLDQLHGEVFKEIHVHGNPLVAADPRNEKESERIQMTFVRKLGISEVDFTKAYHSFAVDTALQRADELVQRYRVTAVPTFVINGKYVADVYTADGAEHLLSLVGDLAAQEHKR
ncbi:MAG TPA: thiol:disulfide interchange protein DsbA/DsbL [Steroidobacteraceae bacterium]|nr:thiol:disulfide interchange protein DsbA/DsbL [Steroidobacteraceae bacterium]